MSVGDLIRGGDRVACVPTTRHILSQHRWYDMAHALGGEPGLHFVALWADATHVHALLDDGAPILVSVAVEAGLYAALSPARPGAALFERAVSDLWGHQAADAADTRAWLDHGTWALLRPLSDRPVPNAAAAVAAEPDYPEMVEAAGDVVSFGPLAPQFSPGPAFWHAGVDGALVQRLEARLGWAHRGVLAQMRGKSPANAARIAARIDGTATVAHSAAFARAVEAAVGFEPPPAAQGLRALMLALERIGTGLHTLHAVAVALGCGSAALEARASLLDAVGAAFGHRFMMDAIRPGGVVAEPSIEALLGLDDALAGLPPLRDRFAEIGALGLSDALALAIRGPFGRASGRQDRADPAAPLLTAGTIGARMALLGAAIERDVEAARTRIANLPAGPSTGVLPHVNAEGLGMAEGPHGPVHHWVRLANGTVAATFPASPAWLHLPAIERAAAGMTLDGLAALVASFGLNPAGMDL